MEVYKVWATLNLKGNAFEKMQKFSQATKLATDRVNKLIAAFTPLTGKLDVLQKRLQLINPSLSKLSTTFIRTSVNTTESTRRFSTLSNTLFSAQKNTDALSRKSDVLAGKLEKISATGEMATASLGRLRGASIAAGGYRIGTGRGRGHGGFSHMGALGLGMIAPEASLLMGGGAAFGAVAGVGILAAQGFKQEKTYQQSLAQLQAQGLSPADLKVAQNFANNPIKGLSPQKMLHAFLDAEMVTKEIPGKGFNDVKELAPLLAMSQFAARSTFGEMSEKQMADMVRVAEIWGGSNHKKVMKGMDLAFQMMSTSAGTIDPSQQLSFMSQGAGAFGRMTDLAYLSMEPIIQEMKGKRAATGLVTLQQQLMGGSGTLNNKRRVEDLISLGLYSATFDKDGRPLGTRANKDLVETFSADPFLFMKKVLAAYAKHGTTSATDIQSRFTLDFGRTPGQELFLMYKNQDKIERQRAMAGGAQGIQSTFQKTFNIPSGATERLTNAWNSLTLAFGHLSSPAIIGGMNALSSFLEKTSTIFNTLGKEVPAIAKSIESKIPSLFSLSKTGSLSNQIKEPNKQSGVTVVHSQINLDGRKVADSVTTHQASTLNAAGTIASPTSVNASLSPTPVGLSNYGGQQ